MLLFKDDESQFNDTMDISLPKNVVAGSVHAVVSTVGKLCIVYVCLSKINLKNSLFTSSAPFLLFVFYECIM